MCFLIHVVHVVDLHEMTILPILRLSGGADAMCWFNPQIPQEIACQAPLLCIGHGWSTYPPRATYPPQK